jgi:hypothetical protein
VPAAESATVWFFHPELGLQAWLCDECERRHTREQAGAAQVVCNYPVLAVLGRLVGAANIGNAGVQLPNAEILFPQLDQRLDWPRTWESERPLIEEPVDRATVETIEMRARKRARIR